MLGTLLTDRKAMNQFHFWCNVTEPEKWLFFKNLWNTFIQLLNIFKDMFDAQFMSDLMQCKTCNLPQCCWRSFQKGFAFDLLCHSEAREIPMHLSEKD